MRPARCLTSPLRHLPVLICLAGLTWAWGCESGGTKPAQQPTINAGKSATANNEDEILPPQSEPPVNDGSMPDKDQAQPVTDDGEPASSPAETEPQ